MPSFEKAVKWLACALLLYGGVKYVLPVLLPFILGLSVAASVQRPAALLSSRVPHLSRKACCVILTSAVMLISTMLVIAAVCSVFDGAMAFCPGIPDRLSHARDALALAASRSGGQSSWGRFVNAAAATAQWCMDFAAENYRQYLPSVLRRSTGLLRGLPSLLTAGFFGVLSALFACGDFERIRQSVRQALPESIADAASRFVQTVVRTVTMLLKTYGTLMLITLCELTAGFGLLRLMGFPVGNILTNALVIALIDILPVLGTGTVLIPWGLFELLTGNAMLGLLLLLLFAVIGAVRNYLEPKFMAKHLELPPFFTLAGVYIGGRLFGASGIVVVPLLMLTVREWRKDKNAADIKACGISANTDKVDSAFP